MIDLVDKDLNTCHKNVLKIASIPKWKKLSSSEKSGKDQE